MSLESYHPRKYQQPLGLAFVIIIILIITRIVIVSIYCLLLVWVGPGSEYILCYLICFSIRRQYCCCSFGPSFTSVETESGRVSSLAVGMQVVKDGSKTQRRQCIFSTCSA